MESVFREVAACRSGLEGLQKRPLQKKSSFSSTTVPAILTLDIGSLEVRYFAKL